MSLLIELTELAQTIGERTGRYTHVGLDFHGADAPQARVTVLEYEDQAADEYRFHAMEGGGYGRQSLAELRDELVNYLVDHKQKEDAA